MSPLPGQRLPPQPKAIIVGIDEMLAAWRVWIETGNTLARDLALSLADEHRRNAATEPRKAA